jgi:hypothetical protein
MACLSLRNRVECLAGIVDGPERNLAIIRDPDRKCKQICMCLSDPQSRIDDDGGPELFSCALLERDTRLQCAVPI